MRNVTRNGGWKTPDWRETSGSPPAHHPMCRPGLPAVRLRTMATDAPRQPFGSGCFPGRQQCVLSFSQGTHGTDGTPTTLRVVPGTCCFSGHPPRPFGITPHAAMPGGCLCSGGIRHAFRREVRLHQDERLELFDVSATLRQATRPEGISTWFFLRFPGFSLRTRKSAANHSHAIHCRQ